MLTLLSEQMLDACSYQNVICHYWVVERGLRLVLIVVLSFNSYLAQSCIVYQYQASEYMLTIPCQ